VNDVVEEAPWRFWPKSLVGRVLVVATTLGFLGYLWVTMKLRFWRILDPWAYDGDQPQACWQYLRYTIDGAFPPGDLITDYAFVMHAPPGWWLLMASLSTFMEPLWAAKLLNIIAYLGTCAAMYVAVARRSNHFVGLAAAALIARSLDFNAIIAGGYARSFGPLLVIAFTGAFLARKHVLVLAILVVQAALYPSVVVPCGFAYGLFTVVAGPTIRERLRRMAGMFVAGLCIIGFGLFQEIRSPDWWGHMVSLDEAMQMPAWQAPGGRIWEAPLKPWPSEMMTNLSRLLRPAGETPLRTFPLAGLDSVEVLAGIAVVALVGVWLLRRRRGERLVDPFPWEPLLVAAMGVVGYFLARAVAFRLYMPYRMLSHVLPYMQAMALPLVAWTLLRNLVPEGVARARASAVTVGAGFLALTLVVGGVFLGAGNGVQRVDDTYRSAAEHSAFFQFLRTKTPLNAQIGGAISVLDHIPLFGQRRVPMNRYMAHPFRKGFYAEAERKIRVMYEALYATSWDEVLRISHEEKIDYWVFSKTFFTRADKNPFEPIRSQVVALYNQNNGRFVFASTPKEAIVWDNGPLLLIDVKKLEAAVASPAPAGP
jgi:hypothetical protein